ncbi:uncharacterized protein LOC143034575 isoform X2 [Oratosquilla oratoria]|uniref:uncharacterized protein LOC143034575 isoform X2 n=1 Tax=Oratosquilla oratoria TaxID=337810 RepID=UPI003F7650B7
MFDIVMSKETFKIFCSNLNLITKSDELHYLFSQYGKVVEAVVIEGKGFGFVHMAKVKEGRKAIAELNRYILNGKPLFTEASTNTRRADPPQIRNQVGQGIRSLDDFSDNARKRRSASLESNKASSSFGSSSGNSSASNYSVYSSHSSHNAVSPHSFPTSKADSAVNGKARTQDVLNTTVSSAVSATNYVQTSYGLPMAQNSVVSSLPYGSHQLDELHPSISPVQRVDANSNSIRSPFDMRTNDVRNELLLQPPSMLKNCDVCGEQFDDWKHEARALFCGHIFCSDCLVSITERSLIKCPRCSMPTQLADGGISGLSSLSSETFRKYYPMDSGISLQSLAVGAPVADKQRLPSMESKVCCTCLKTQPTPMCERDGHKVMRSSQAPAVLTKMLDIELETSLEKLRDTMSLTVNMRERMELTLKSVERFAEELKAKIEEQVFEEALLHSFLKGLNVIMNKPSDRPLSEILDDSELVQSYAKDITAQHLQSCALNAVNTAPEAILLQLKQSVLADSLSSLGFKFQEAFPMTSTLEQHAVSGNCANVILLYMLSDLLATRIPQHLLRADTMGMGLPTPGHSSVMGGSPLATMNGNITDLSSHDMTGMGNDQLIDPITSIHSPITSIHSPITSIHSPITSIHSPNTNMHIPHSSENTIVTALSLGLSNITILGSSSRESSSPVKDELLLSSPVDVTEDHNEEEKSPVSYVDAAKKPAKPAPMGDMQPKVLPPVVKASKFPHCWMTISINGAIEGRVIIEIRPDKAPRMCENFMGLCSGKAGYGYQGSLFFRSGEGILAGGDIENNDGTGGYSIYDRKPFEADLCPLKDEYGAIRFKGCRTSDTGRGMVGSQFMIWCGEREFKKFTHSLVFGRVVEGMNVVKKASDTNVYKYKVMIEDCGVVVA